MSDQRRSYSDQPFVHFVTFSVHQRRRLLDLDQPKQIVLGVLSKRLQAMSARCVGFVVMPDHVHALLWLPDPAELPRFMHGWKRISSFGIRSWYLGHAANYFREFGIGDRFWRPKYYAFQIDNESKLEEKLEYMDLNPVRAGLVDVAADWAWSSARWYSLKNSVGVPISWIDS